MTFTLIQSLSLPGDPGKPNEDAFGHDGGAAVVMDGATPLFDGGAGGLMPGPSDAAWIAQFGARRLLAHLRAGEGARKALRGALADAEKSFNALRRAPLEEVWQTPCASMMLAVAVNSGPPPLRAQSAQEGEGEPRAQAAANETIEDASGEAGEHPRGVRLAVKPTERGRRGSEIEFLWFGDCAAVLKPDDAPALIIGENFTAKSQESGFAAQVAREKGQAATDRAHFLEQLRARRNRINSGGYWLFSPDTRPAAHAGRRIVKAKPGALLLLASDGFLALASDYGAYSVDGLMQACRSKGLAALGEELRAIEAADARGEKFPRFKKSDDATALLLRLED